MTSKLSRLSSTPPLTLLCVRKALSCFFGDGRIFFCVCCILLCNRESLRMFAYSSVHLRLRFHVSFAYFQYQIPSQSSFFFFSFVDSQTFFSLSCVIRGFFSIVTLSMKMCQFVDFSLLTFTIFN